MGKDQYHPSAEPSAKNRLFTMYHAQYSKHERRRIVDELVNGKSSHRVLFVTVAFAIGIDCNDIHRIVHTGVRYTRLGGLAEMALQLGLTLIIMTFQKPLKNIPEAMRSYVQSKEFQRKIILNHFDHKVPDNQPVKITHAVTFTGYTVSVKTVCLCMQLNRLRHSVFKMSLR